MRPRPIHRAIAVAAMALLPLVGTMPAANAAALVRGYSTAWSRTVVPIARGGSVRWNATEGSHNVRAYGGNWTYRRTLPQGTSTAPRVFNHVGIFRFFCSIHGHLLANGSCSGMCGRVVVR